MKKSIVKIFMVSAACFLVGCGSRQTEPAQTQAGTESRTEAPAEELSYDLTGSWVLDTDQTDMSGFSDSFASYEEFGAGLTVGTDNTFSWYVGIEGGSGTYEPDGKSLQAELVKDLDGEALSMLVSVELNGEDAKLSMEYSDRTLYWMRDLEGSVIRAVNPRGDEIKLYKLSDGSYADDDNNKYIFDGRDTWTDEKGTEWNEAL